MTRAVPMDELLVQMAETLHSSLAPAGAEVWVASDEALVRTVAVPDQPPTRLTLGADELAVVEAMNNAGKHAGEGATITVSMHRHGDSVEFEVADDGAGYEPELATEGQGFLNMRDRVGAYGGDISVDSAPGKGTRVHGRVPVPVAAV